MTSTVDILASFECSKGNKSLEDHQGATGNPVDTPITIVTTDDPIFDNVIEVAAAGAAGDVVTIWDDDDAHGVDELSFVWIRASFDAVLEWQTADETNPDDVSTISIRKNVPFLMHANESGIIQAFKDHVTHEPLDEGGAEVLEDVTRIRIRNYDDAAGLVYIAGFK